MSFLRSAETWTNLGSVLVAALKINAIPGLVLFALEVALIVMFYQCIPCNPAFVWISDIKNTYGYLYSSIATAFFGGFLPFCIGLLTKEV